MKLGARQAPGISDGRRNAYGEAYKPAARTHLAAATLSGLCPKRVIVVGSVVDSATHETY